MSDTPDAQRAGSSVLAGTVLAFDFGTRKIGVALGNTITGNARALMTLREERSSARMASIEAVVREWQPDLLVVGRPLHADGMAHAVTALADQFSRDLGQRFGLPVVQVDERYTTQLAQYIPRAGGSRDPGRDAHAAQLILQAWLDARPHEVVQSGPVFRSAPDA